MGAAIGQWIRLCLPSCGPGFDPQPQHLGFFNLYLNCDEKRTKINQKRPGFANHFINEGCEFFKLFIRNKPMYKSQK